MLWPSQTNTKIQLIIMDYNVFKSSNNKVFNSVLNHKYDQTSMHTKLQQLTKLLSLFKKQQMLSPLFSCAVANSPCRIISSISTFSSRFTLPTNAIYIANCFRLFAAINSTKAKDIPVLYL